MRPWLLLPKVLCVGVLLGGLVSVMVLSPAPANADWAGWHERVEFLRRAYIRVLIPSLCGVILTGLLLAAQHWRAFLRMRWFQLKLVLVLFLLPGVHLAARHFWLQTKSAVESHADPGQLARADMALQTGITGALVLVIAVIVLGRLKPRLGQNYGRTFGRSASSAKSSGSSTERPGEEQ